MSPLSSSASPRICRQQPSFPLVGAVELRSHDRRSFHGEIRAADSTLANAFARVITLLRPGESETRRQAPKKGRTTRLSSSRQMRPRSGQPDFLKLRLHSTRAEANSAGAIAKRMRTAPISERDAPASVPRSCVWSVSSSSTRRPEFPIAPGRGRPHPSMAPCRRGNIRFL